MSTNYASELGIKNKWAPIVFAAMYFLLFVWYVMQAIRRHAGIYGGLAFFAARKSSFPSFATFAWLLIVGSM